MDRGFCVVKAILDLDSHSVLSSYLTKKRRRQPSFIDRYNINEYMSSKPVGFTDSKIGILGIQVFKVISIKEPDYNLIIISTYSSLSRPVSVKMNK